MNNDIINHPSHYTDGKIEVIDFIEDKKLNFHRGNAIKYISRAGKKDPQKEIEDLEKAIWYLSREVLRLKGIDGKPELKRSSNMMKVYICSRYSEFLCSRPVLKFNGPVLSKKNVCLGSSVIKESYPSQSFSK